MNAPCRHCTHPRKAHEHYRRGRDCSLCPCPRYARRWPWHLLAAVLLLTLLALVPVWYVRNEAFNHCLGASKSYARAEVCAGTIQPGRPAQASKGTPHEPH